MPPTARSRLRLRPAFTGDGSGKLHLTLTKKATLCGVTLPARSMALDGDTYGRWFNDDGCRSCAKEARKIERGCTRCPAILFTPDHVSRGTCPACHRKKRKPNLRPSQVAAQREREKAAKAAAKAARAPWTTWPPPAPLRLDDWRHRPMVSSWHQAESLLQLQRAFDQLDGTLMADPHPAPPDITVGRRQTNDGQIYTFHHPVLGLLGEIHMLVLYGRALRFEPLIAGTPEDPMSARRIALLDPIIDVLLARFQAAAAAGPLPVLQGHIPTLTNAPAYLDPERLRTRDYHCTRCDAVVAQLVLADSVMEDAIRLLLCERPLPAVPTWVVELAADEGEGEARMCPVVQILPERTAAVVTTAPAFEKQIRRLRLAHCREPQAPKKAKGS